METYIIHMPVGGYGSPPYSDHCMGVVTDKEPGDNGRIVLTRAEYEAGFRVELTAHRPETVYDVEKDGDRVTLIPA